MKIQILRPLAILLAIFLVFPSFTPPEKKWTYLLDQELSQWDTYLSYRHQNSYDGKQPTDENGNRIEPIGYNNDQPGVFTLAEEDGEPILHVSGEIYGCIFTKKEFENYHLSLQIKWGDKKYEPRLDKLKDSGLLYHSIGKAGVDYWRSWMLSQEFQVMEGHMGDYWSIANSAIDIRAFLPEGMMNTLAGHDQPFLPIGRKTGRDGFCLRSVNNESPEGEWTTLELVTIGDKSLHIVNGKVVMVLQHSRVVTDGKTTPLTKGKIQLQSEAAECFYKAIRIKPIIEWPAKYAGYFD
ncbi:DUF1080 domain-containing protein [uncultured Sunxiuqinia sp.]|uniref:3-keto-disaccharide hydrolase n=1 Tax=uncultured Sunxiuqinia sp. TaxID=1573825 RepID=UPI002AA76E8A|nr:DUF1080 domain-containing protein [uncultured Sunxiuqinia sp.]